MLSDKGQRLEGAARYRAENETMLDPVGMRHHTKAMADPGDAPSSLPHTSRTRSSFRQSFLSGAPPGASALIGELAKAV